MNEVQQRVQNVNAEILHTYGLIAASHLLVILAVIACPVSVEGQLLRSSTAQQPLSHTPPSTNIDEVPAASDVFSFRPYQSSRPSYSSWSSYSPHRPAGGGAGALPRWSERSAPRSSVDERLGFRAGVPLPGQLPAAAQVRGADRPESHRRNLPQQMVRAGSICPSAF